MTFAPVLPWWLLTAAALGVLVLSARAFRPVLTGKSRRRSLLLRCGAVLCLLLAAFRPGVSEGESSMLVADLDVYFVVDTTASMAAEDFDGHRPRLDGVRADIMAAAERLAGAKFGLITFNDTARVAMPLSRDTSALAAASSSWATARTPVPHVLRPWESVQAWSPGEPCSATERPTAAGCAKLRPHHRAGIQPEKLTAKQARKLVGEDPGIPPTISRTPTGAMPSRGSMSLG